MADRAAERRHRCGGFAPAWLTLWPYIDQNLNHVCAGNPKRGSFGLGPIGPRSTQGFPNRPDRPPIGKGYQAAL
jgi:hypothetical protein